MRQIYLSEICVKTLYSGLDGEAEAWLELIEIVGMISS